MIRPTLARVLERHGWAGIDDLIQACKDNEVFGPGFPARALEIAMKSEVRRLLKRGVRDISGRVLKVANIFTYDEETKQKKRVYKQESLLDLEDIGQVIRYWRRNRKKGDERIAYYIAMAVSTHGERARQMFMEFGDSPAESAA